MKGYSWVAAATLCGLAVAQAQTTFTRLVPGMGDNNTPPPKDVAKPAPTKIVTETVGNASQNYLDDGLVWNHHIRAKQDPAGAYVYCIPADTKLLGIKSTLDSVYSNETTTAKKEDYLAVILDRRKPFLGLLGPVQDELVAKPWRKQKPGEAAKGKSADKPITKTENGVTYIYARNECGKMPDMANSKPFHYGDVAYVAAEDLGTVAYRGGFDYGALAVPFKVQMSGGRSFSGAAAIGAYLGYRMPWMNTGVEVRPIIFAGVSNITTSAANGTGGTTSQTVAGLSYGTGFITTIKDSFQIGLVVGFDHVDSAQPYAYNDTPWLSVEIGYSFAN